MELKIPVKTVKVASKKDVAEDPFVVDDRKLSASPKSISNEQGRRLREAPQEVRRGKFDLPESTYFFPCSGIGGPVN